MASEDSFQLGCAYVKEGNYREALVYFRRQMNVYESDPSKEIPPAFLSHYGLAMAMAEDRVFEGIEYCKKAIKQERRNPDFYWNLGKVYRKADQKLNAVYILSKGLKLDKNHQGIANELRELGIRQPPVLPFLPRRHFLNKYLGLLRARFLRKK
jgi:tetratricopeptide (TPR) repeat protein